MRASLVLGLCASWLDVADTRLKVTLTSLNVAAAGMLMTAS
jgi:hypothetical protein